MLRGDVVKLGDPTPERDLLYIDDHVDAYLTCFAKPEASIGEAFNFCTGERLTVRALGVPPFWIGRLFLQAFPQAFTETLEAKFARYEFPGRFSHPACAFGILEQFD